MKGQKFEYVHMTESKSICLIFQHILQVQPLPKLCKGHILWNSTQVKFYVQWNCPKLY